MKTEPNSSGPGRGPHPEAGGPGGVRGTEDRRVVGSPGDSPPGEPPWGDDPGLDALLRELPRTPASPGFSRRLLRRLEQHPEPAPGLWRPPWRPLLAGALALALLLGGGWLWSAEQRRERLQQELLALKQEQQRLQQELLRLQRRVDRAPPLLYLGSDTKNDYVLDLTRLPPALPAAAAPDGPAPPPVRGFVPHGGTL